MSVACIGISHKTAAVKVRERFSFTHKRLEETLNTLKGIPSILGAVILSTCNRVEFYLDLAPQESSLEAKRVVVGICQATEYHMKRYFYIFEGIEAVKHLFRVSSGLDSQVLGETQILAQVESGWSIAKKLGTASRELDEIFFVAQKTAKMVRSQTKISCGNVSVGSVAIKLLEEKLGNLKNYTVLIIGAGKTGSLISTYLKERKIRGIFVANRTYTHAQELAAACSGKVIDFKGLETELMDIDIVISSTSSPHIILKKEMLMRVMETREKPLFILDLAVPRDVDPAVKGIEGIWLHDLDGLKSVAEENYRNREKEATVAEKLIEDSVSSNYACV